MMCISLRRKLSRALTHAAHAAAALVREEAELRATLARACAANDARLSRVSAARCVRIRTSMPLPPFF
jgi:hypothetical protein